MRVGAGMRLATAQAATAAIRQHCRDSFDAMSRSARVLALLGGTFDPFVLKSLGVIGVAADALQARNWYQKAAELGSREAPQRIDQLAQYTR